MAWGLFNNPSRFPLGLVSTDWAAMRPWRLAQLHGQKADGIWPCHVLQPIFSVLSITCQFTCMPLDGVVLRDQSLVWGVLVPVKGKTVVAEVTHAPDCMHTLS